MGNCTHGGQYAWCLDWENDEIYASTHAIHVPEIVPEFHRFDGYYTDTNGDISTKPVGPVAWWNNLTYDFYKPTETGEYQVILLGLNSRSKNWDTLKVDAPAGSVEKIVEC